MWILRGIVCFTILTHINLSCFAVQLYRPVARVVDLPKGPLLATKWVNFCLFVGVKGGYVQKSTFRVQKVCFLGPTPPKVIQATGLQLFKSRDNHFIIIIINSLLFVKCCHVFIIRNFDVGKEYVIFQQ